MFKKISVGFYIFLTIVLVIWIVQLLQDVTPYIDLASRPFVATVVETEVFEFFCSVTILGGRKFLIPFTIVMAFVLWYLYKSLLPAIFFGLGTYGGHLFNVFMKLLVQRERPSISLALDAVGYSFRSGNAMNAIVCFSFLVYFLMKRMQGLFGKVLVWIGTSSIIVIVGISRYIINVHFLTDVIAGYYFGFLYVWLLLFVYRKVRQRGKSGNFRT